MRLVDNVGGDSLFLLDNENIKREASIKKIAGLSYSNVNLIYKKSAEFFTSIQEDYTIVAIETSEQSTNIFTTPLPGKVVFLIGSEAHGLPADLIQLCDRCVHIPMTGKCKSMNISHATAVGLFEWLRQQLFFR
jgi:TrmH family RNA methyltransferase